MESKIYENKVSNVYAGARLMRFGFFVMLVCQAMLCLLVLKLETNRRTVVAFPGLQTVSAGEVSSNTADENYLRRAIGYVVRTYLCYSSASIRSQYDELLSLYAPETYSQQREGLYKTVQDVESAKGFGSIFSVSRISYDPQKGYVEAEGLRQVYNEGIKKLEETQTYIINYVIRDGRFYIKDIQQKVKA